MKQEMTYLSKRNEMQQSFNLFCGKTREAVVTRSEPRATQAGLPCESEVMKLRSVKTNLLLVLLCSGLLAAVPLPASAQVSPASSPGAIASENPRSQRQFPYGLLGRLGLLGLAGLIRKKDKSDKDRSSGNRPPAPPGSYVSDLKTDPRTKPQ